jgi:hypothetical protein
MGGQQRVHGNEPGVGALERLHDSIIVQLVARQSSCSWLRVNHRAVGCVRIQHAL